MAKPTQVDIRNNLGDDISWKSLYAQQNDIYPTREAAIADAIKWCGNVDIKLVAELLLTN